MIGCNCVFRIHRNRQNIDFFALNQTFTFTPVCRREVISIPKRRSGLFLKYTTVRRKTKHPLSGDVGFSLFVERQQRNLAARKRQICTVDTYSTPGYSWHEDDMRQLCPARGPRSLYPFSAKYLTGVAVSSSSCYLLGRITRFSRFYFKHSPFSRKHICLLARVFAKEARIWRRAATTSAPCARRTTRPARCASRETRPLPSATAPTITSSTTSSTPPRPSIGSWRGPSGSAPRTSPRAGLGWKSSAVPIYLIPSSMSDVIRSTWYAI